MKNLIKRAIIILAQIVRIVMVVILAVAIIAFMWVFGNVIHEVYLHTDRGWVNIPDSISGPLFLNLVFSSALILLPTVTIVKISDGLKKLKA